MLADEQYRYHPDWRRVRDERNDRGLLVALIKDPPWAAAISPVAAFPAKVGDHYPPA
jgi:hypothetical protein